MQNSPYRKYVPVGYFTESEYEAFLGHYLSNDLKNIENYWIVKHPNLARSLDMIVTKDL